MVNENHLNLISKAGVITTTLSEKWQREAWVDGEFIFKYHQSKKEFNTENISLVCHGSIIDGINFMYTGYAVCEECLDTPL